MGREREERREKKEKERKKWLNRGWLWWYRSIILRLEMLRQRDHEFEGSLGYKESLLPAQKT